MAKSSLLNTSTATFLDLIGNGRSFRVPNYQRDYSWTEEQWEDLWNDLTHLHAHPDARHFMGAVVLTGVAENPDRAFWIIDGQQRFVTLSILVLAVIRRLQELADQGVDPAGNRERASTLRSRFLGEKDPASLVEASKLRLNESDDPFYQDYVLRLKEHVSLRSLPRSSQLLWKCLIWFGNHIRAAEFGRDGPALTRMVTEAAARQLLFIRIEVDDDLSAFMVFETLNARGLGLSPADLIKNFLFAQIRLAADLRVLERRWAELIGTVRQEDFPDFLRYHLLCERPRVRQQHLFKILKEEVSEPAKVFELIDALTSRATLFAALRDDRHELWIDRPECKKHIRELMTFRVRQMTPLLFAAWDRLNDRFGQILRMIVVISFRYSVVGKRNSSDLEPVYHRAARAVLEGRATSAEAVFRELEAIYIDDRTFENDFRGFEIRARGPGQKLARYVLAELEAALSGKPCDPLTADFTVEHVLPQSPSEDWLRVLPEARVPALVDRLGNLLPLEKSANREIGNAGFEKKLERYAQSAYATARELVEHRPPDWNPEALDQRQARQAGLARQVWRLDYARGKASGDRPTDESTEE